MYGIATIYADQGDDTKALDWLEKAIKNGAKLLVVGRPITRAEDPAKAADIIVEEIEKALV